MHGLLIQVHSMCRHHLTLERARRTEGRSERLDLPQLTLTGPMIRLACTVIIPGGSAMSTDQCERITTYSTLQRAVAGLPVVSLRYIK